MRRRALVLGVPCLVVLAVLVATAWTFREPLRRGVPQRQSIEAGVLRRLGVWTARRPVDPRPGALIFGDSLLVCTEATPLSKLLGEELAAAGRSYDVLSIAHPAFRPLIAYYLLDDMLAARPALFVIGLNVRTLAAATTEPSFRFASLSRLLGPERALAARTALAADDLGPLAPSLYRLEERLDLLYVADGVREAGRVALDGAGQWINRRLGTGGAQELRDIVADLQTRRDESARQAAIATYAVDYATSVQAGVLRLVLAELRAAGTRVLVYVSPVNVESLARLGLGGDALELPRRLEELRVAIGAARDEWLDLHASEGADGFHDVWNHLRRPACARVAARIAAAVPTE